MMIMALCDVRSRVRIYKSLFKHLNRVYVGLQDFQQMHCRCCWALNHKPVIVKRLSPDNQIFWQGFNSVTIPNYFDSVSGKYTIPPDIYVYIYIKYSLSKLDIKDMISEMRPCYTWANPTSSSYKVFCVQYWWMLCLICLRLSGFRDW